MPTVEAKATRESHFRYRGVGTAWGTDRRSYCLTDSLVQSGVHGAGGSRDAGSAVVANPNTATVANRDADAGIAGALPNIDADAVTNVDADATTRDAISKAVAVAFTAPCGPQCAA